MKRLLVIVSAACAMAACNNAATTTGADSTAALDSSSGAATATSLDTAATSLFDGKTLANWHTYGQNAPGKNWVVDSGCIKQVAGVDGKDLLSNEEYGNFDLKLEWKISKDGNSGVLIYVHEDTAKYAETYFTGPEMQVLDNVGHPDAKIIKHRASDLYDMITSSPETVKPAAEWNAAEIKSLNGDLTFYLNGTQVLHTTMWDDNWRQMVAGSKFKKWPDFGTFKTGHIALQNHGNDVWYRNITIKKL